MKSLIMLPIALGFIAVLQAALNRQIARHLGFFATTVLSGTSLVLVSVCVLMVVALRGPWLPDGFTWEAVRWWWILPGVCGCLIVTGMPYSLSKLGALPVFIALVGAQVVGSMMWDVWIEGVAITPQKLMGAVLAIASVLLVNWESGV